MNEYWRDFITKAKPLPLAKGDLVSVEIGGVKTIYAVADIQPSPTDSLTLNLKLTPIAQEKDV